MDESVAVTIWPRLGNLGKGGDKTLRQPTWAGPDIMRVVTMANMPATESIRHTEEKTLADTQSCPPAYLMWKIWREGTL